MKEVKEIIKGREVFFTADKVVLQKDANQPAIETPYWVCYYSVNPQGGFLGELIRDGNNQVVVFNSAEEAIEISKQLVHLRTK